MARLESYSQAQWVMCDLVSLSQQTLAELATQAYSQQHQLELCELNNPIYVQGLPTLLQVLLRNLLDNAMRLYYSSLCAATTAASDLASGG